MDILHWKVTEMQLYRLLAKGVAIFDLVLSTISMMLVTALVTLDGTKATTRKYKNLENRIRLISDPHYPVSIGLLDAPVWALFVIVGICAILSALRMWTAIRLLSATQRGREPFRALQLASTWRNVSVVFLVVDIVGLSLLPPVFAIPLLLDGVMMCIVCRYMLVLKQERIITSVPVSVTEEKISTSSSIP